MTPKVSLITTIYNRARYLGSAIESALSQSFEDFELILWDDGSTDPSVEIAQEYANKDQRIRFVAANHQGRSKSLFDAHALARGEYVGWLDSDDLLTPKALEYTVSILDSYSEFGVVYSDHDLIDEQGVNKGPGRHCKMAYSKHLLLLDFMTHHFRLIRRSVFELAGGIDVVFPCSIDYDLCLRLSEVTEIYHLPLSIYLHRVHDDRMSKNQKLDQIEWAKEAISRALVRRGMDSDWKILMDVQPTQTGAIKGNYRLTAK